GAVGIVETRSADGAVCVRERERGEVSAHPVMAEAARVSAGPEFYGLTELTEEEEVFLAIADGKEQGPGGGLLLSTTSPEAPSTRDMENQFLHLAIKKQVSYR
ncbi:hypothetical protein chiPu_0024444, partial [Chiloscyllium punctatum]|nr:hypothetical protein [Chiloscyllium punctatum]